MDKGTITRIGCVTIPRHWIDACILSVPAWEHLKGKLGLCRDTIRKGAPPEEELPKRGYDPICSVGYDRHLNLLGLSPADKFILTGARNLGNNLGTVAWDRQKGLFELLGENAATNGREYTCFCQTADERLTIARVAFAGGKPNRDDLNWAVSGPELVWNSSPSPLWRIISYDYDLRHVWKTKFEMDSGPMRVGRVPTEEATHAVIQLSNKFVETLYLPAEQATREITEVAAELNLQRENNYLHSALGIKENGDVMLFQMSGSFEQASALLVLLGTNKAIEMDQGGSCQIAIGGDKELQTSAGIPLFSSHHFRKWGLAVLIFSLNSLDFIDWGDSLKNLKV